MCLGDIFGGGGGGGSDTQTVNQTTKVQLPAWLEDAAKSAIGKAEPLADQEYPVYGGQRLAGFSPDQLEAFQRARENVGSWQPIYQQALASTAQSGQAVGQNDINAYMNPYTQDVIDATTNQINRQFDQETIARNASMANRGSYLNEDRRELINAEAQSNKNRVLAEAVAGLNLQGYNNALNQANIQRDRDARTATMYSQLAPQLSALNYGDIGALADVGQQQQAQNQQNLSLQYEDFLRQFYFPQEQLNWLTGVIQGQPYGSTTTGTTTSPVAGTNTAGNILGGASAGYGLGDNFGMGGWGALAGGILGAFG